MKKLSLKNLKLEANDMLQRNQLKTIFGGYSGCGSWNIYCKDPIMFYAENCGTGPGEGQSLCENHGGFSMCSPDGGGPYCP